MAGVDPTSRYADRPVLAIPDGAGGTRLLSAPRVVPTPSVAGGYAVRPGDRLDLLAREAFGDTTQWWRLADANPHADPTRLEEPGRSIDLPGG
jgi:hypothetical protein